MLAGKRMVCSLNHSRVTLGVLLACSHSNHENFVQDFMACLYQHGIERSSISHCAQTS